MTERVTAHEVAAMSAEELLRAYGIDVVQQLVDLIVAALKRDDDDQVRLLDGRRREIVDQLRRTEFAAPPAAPGRWRKP